MERRNVGGRRQGRGGGGAPNRQVSLSKLLSYLLRHGAKKEGLNIDESGYVLVDEILALNQVKKMSQPYTQEEVLEVVASNEKQRFGTKEENGKLFIRAKQGHSIKDLKLDLKKVQSSEELPVVLHGTFKKNWASIKQKGLNKMSRTHIHMATGKLGDKNVISGIRSTCDMLIYIDLESALKDGIEFFISENGVVLSEGVDGVLSPKYFAHVVDANTMKPFDPDFNKPPVGMN